MLIDKIERIDIALIKIYESDNFIIYGKDEEKENYSEIIKLLNKNYKRLTDEYNTNLMNKVILEIYPSLDIFHKNMFEGKIPNIDFKCFDWMLGCHDEISDSIKIVSPSNPGSKNSSNSVIKTALHELVHLFTMKKIKNSSNNNNKNAFMKVFWIHEGIAVYESRQFEDFIETFKKSVLKYIPDVKELNQVNYRYLYSWSLVSFIIETFSKNKLIELFTDYESLIKILGIDKLELQDNWKEWIKKRYLK